MSSWRADHYNYYHRRVEFLINVVGGETCFVRIEPPLRVGRSLISLTHVWCALDVVNKAVLLAFYLNTLKV